MEAGEILRTLRKKQGLTQAQVAAKMNVGTGYISQIESGKAGFSAKQAIGQIEKGYGVDGRVLAAATAVMKCRDAIKTGDRAARSRGQDR